MAYEYISLEPAPKLMASEHISSELAQKSASSTPIKNIPSKDGLDNLFENYYDELFGGNKATLSSNSTATPISNEDTHTTYGSSTTTFQDNSDEPDVPPIQEIKQEPQSCWDL